MAKDLADLEQRGSCSSHFRGSRVPQPVGSDRGQSRPPAGLHDEPGDGIGRQGAVGGPRMEEQLPMAVARPAPSAVVRHGAAHVDGQRKPVPVTSLACDGDLAGAPVEVFEREAHHLFGPQPQAGQDRQDGEVPPAGSTTSVAACQQETHVGWANAFDLPLSRHAAPLGTQSASEVAV